MRRRRLSAMRLRGLVRKEVLQILRDPSSIMIALVFLYIIAAIFIIGAELNAAIIRFREARALVAAASSRSAQDGTKPAGNEKL